VVVRKSAYPVVDPVYAPEKISETTPRVVAAIVFCQRTERVVVIPAVYGAAKTVGV